MSISELYLFSLLQKLIFIQFWALKWANDILNSCLICFFLGDKGDKGDRGPEGIGVEGPMGLRGLPGKIYKLF